MANKTFNTRVKNKRDTAANWEAVATTFQPLDGELIIVDTAAGKTRFKVGRYDTAKGRLLYYNEIPFTDEYLYNDLNESQGKIYDKLKGIDDKSIIESTLEPAAGADDKLYVYNIGLWQFPKTGFYKIKLTKVGALGILLKLYARITKDDGTTPDDWDNNNLKAMGNASGDGLIEEIYAQVDYINDDKFTVYRVQFFNCFGYLGSFWVNTYDKTTQKWAYDYKHRVTADHVSNKLTLTKGDTTTVYDGSVAREVSIPTKTSELTNDSFISYAEQTLTEGQQNQAKTNLGIDVLTGNTTTVTPTQVKEAILEGRPVAITYTDTTYGNLTFTSFGYSLENNVVVANLVATSNGQYILADLTGRINTNNWTLQTTELGTSTDIENNYVKYSESQTLTDKQKATARTNIGANFEPFKVTLSRTYGKPYLDKTPKEIYDAYTAGKYVYLEGNSLLPLTSAGDFGNKYTISFSGTSKVSENYNVQVTSFSVINVTSDYSGQWIEDYKYNIDAKVLKLNYNISTNEVSGSNPYNSIAKLNASDQIAVVQLNVTNANNKLYLNQIATIDNNTFIFQAFVDDDEMLTLIIASNSMQIQALHIINENNIKNIVDQSYVAFYTEQALSDKEKKQARDNIGAVSSSDLVQSDWNQNDTTAKDYIKNRICYTKDATETIVLNSTLSFTDISQQDKTVFSYQDTSSSIKFNEGTVYNVNFDSISYSCIAFTNTNIPNCVILGNLGVVSELSSATNEPFVMVTDSKGSQGLQILTNLTGISHSVKITEIHTEIIKLDKKYIPDDIFTSIENIDNKVEDFINNTQFLTKTDSVGTGSFSFNRETGSTVGENSATFGLNNIASGNNAFAEGAINKATGLNSHAEGNATTASGNAAHAEGSSTKATGDKSHAEGLDTIASGNYSHTEGENTTAENKWSHAEGKDTNTKGLASHAEGIKTIAQGNYSHAEGRDTIALGENQHVEGMLNIGDETSLHIVGNGTYSTMTKPDTRSNAYTLDRSGNAWFAGDVYVGSTSGTNKDDGSKKLATEEYVDGQMTTINNQLGGLTGAMHFIGKAAVDITDGSTTNPQIANYTTKEKGDVILGKDDHKEFVWNGAIWEELGDEGSYALKTTTINGKALSDNITLTASDVGAASASTIETMQAAIDSKPSAADAVYTATAASTDGVAYTATVSGIDSLTVGASFIMIPNKASTSKAPTLNVNGLGAKPIRRRLSSLTTSLQQGYSTNWIALNKPFTVVYDGTAWVIEGLTKTDGADVYGAVAQATADAKGNNIADTYATIAMLQSLLPKVTTITLTSNWVGDASPYYQDIALSCVTETSIVDLQPTPEQLNSWQDDGIAFTTLSGNGTVRVYVAGGKPSSAISVQVRVQEVTVI